MLNSIKEYFSKEGTAARKKANFDRMKEKIERKTILATSRAKLRGKEADVKEQETRISNAVTRRMLNKQKINKGKMKIHSCNGSPKKIDIISPSGLLQ